MSLSHSTFRDLGAQALIGLLVSHLGLPLMVKPQHGGSALGATPVRSAEELPAALVGAFAYGEIVVVEEFVDGVELAITVVEEGDDVVALPAVEISPDSGFFDYESRYTAGLTTYFTPARLDRRGGGRGGGTGGRRAPGAGPDGHLADRRHCHPGRSWCISWRSTCRPGYRDLDAADVGGRGRHVTSARSTPAWSSGPIARVALIARSHRRPRELLSMQQLSRTVEARSVHEASP